MLIKTQNVILLAQGGDLQDGAGTPGALIHGAILGQRDKGQSDWPSYRQCAGGDEVDNAHGMTRTHVNKDVPFRF